MASSLSHAVLAVLFLLSKLLRSQETAASAKAPPKCDFTQIEVRDECPSPTGFDWEGFGEALYRSRSFVFLGDIDGAKKSVHQLLTVATSPFSLAFECPPAVAATYFSLAQILAFQGRMRRALAMVQMGFVFIRDKGFSECTPWPLQGWDMLLAGRNLLHNVQELDRQAIARDTPPAFRAPGLRIAVVTICAYAEDEPVRVLSGQNHQLFTQLHGYDLFFYTDSSQIAPHIAGRMDVTDGKHKPFFWKVNAVRNVFDDPKKYDWVLWADCDAFFMDPERTLDSIVTMYTSDRRHPLRRAPPEDLALRANPPDPPPVSLIVAVDSTGINNGVWLLRNDAWGRQFLDEWWHSDILQGAGKEHNCSDQSTMQHLLLHDRAMRLDAAWDEAEGPMWPPEVRIAAQEHMQSFHEATAISVLSREWQDGDFIKHHPGCHYYKAPCQQMYWDAASIFQDKAQALVQRRALM